ncbi:MAG: SMI1/KNR4 family protein [Elusimicrobiota bacterium]
MSNPDYDAALEEIDENPELAHFIGAMPPASVAAAERALGVALPQSYRDFLLRFGAGNFGSFAVFGIPDPELATPRVPNAVWYTLQERKSGLPPALVAVGTDFEGTLFCLDTEAAAAGDAPMVNWKAGKITPFDLTFSQYFRDGVEEEGEEEG